MLYFNSVPAAQRARRRFREEYTTDDDKTRSISIEDFGGGSFRSPDGEQARAY